MTWLGRVWWIPAAALAGLGCPSVEEADDTEGAGTEAASDDAGSSTTASMDDGDDGSSAGSDPSATSVAEDSTTATDPDDGSDGDASATVGGSSGDGTTGEPAIACSEGADEASCVAAGGATFDCAWFPSSIVVIETMMCVEVGTGGICLQNVADDGCGHGDQPSCSEGESLVYVRPSDLQKGAVEIVILEEGDTVCETPAGMDGFELCQQGIMLQGCRCGCA